MTPRGMVGQKFLQILEEAELGARSTGRQTSRRFGRSAHRKILEIHCTDLGQEAVGMIVRFIGERQACRISLTVPVEHTGKGFRG